MSNLKLKNGLRVKARFNLEDGRELIGEIDNYDDYADPSIEPTFTLMNEIDDQCYLVGISDIYEIVEDVK